MPRRVSPTGRSKPWPAATTRALERDRWYDVLHLMVAVPPADPRLAALQRVVAAAMRARAHGDVLPAWRLLQDAVRMLPPHWTKPDPEGVAGDRLAVIPPGDVAPWTYRTVCVICREQYELSELRKRFRVPRPGRAELEDALIEYLCRVESNVDVWRDATRRFDSISLNRSDSHLYERANQLRRMAVPTAGDLTYVDRRAGGGYGAVREDALRTLAATPLPSSIRGAPVPLGRRRARRYAQKWLAAVNSFS